MSGCDEAAAEVGDGDGGGAGGMGDCLTSGVDFCCSSRFHILISPQYP
jgi:hypothetical protein